MMTGALIAFLLAQDPVKALVGQNIAPGNSGAAANSPRIVVRQTGGSHVLAMDGPSHLASAQYDVACWAQTVAVSEQVAQAVEDALAGFAGAMGAVTVQCCAVKGEHDLLDAEPGLEMAAQYGKIIELAIWHTE